MNNLKGRARAKGIGTNMHIKFASELLVIVWTLRKKKECFDPKYLKNEDQDSQKSGMTAKYKRLFRQESPVSKVESG